MKLNYNNKYPYQVTNFRNNSLLEAKRISIFAEEYILNLFSQLKIILFQVHLYYLCFVYVSKEAFEKLFCLSERA